MEQFFKPLLLDSYVSSNYINPGDSLWVTLTWQNIGGAPAAEDFRFFLDMEFGHQRKLENKQCDFRVTSAPVPQTTLWYRGTVVKVTLKWENLSNWSGTFRLYTGISDRNKAPVPFYGEEGQLILHQYIGKVDSSWNLGRPWVKEMAHGVNRQYNEKMSILKMEEGKIEPVILQDQITVELNDNSPMVLAMKDAYTIYSFYNSMPITRILDRNSGLQLSEGESNFSVTYSLLDVGDIIAVYVAKGYVGHMEAVSFEMMIRLDGRQLQINIQNIMENDPYELLEVRYNALAEMDDGYLLDFFGSGRLIPIKTATPTVYEKNYDVRNAAALYDDKGMILVESMHMDSKISTGIIYTEGKNRGIIGGSIVARIRGEKGIPSIKVKEPPVFTIELAELQGKVPDWKLAARLLRRGVYPNPNKEMYKNTYFYKQLATWGPLPNRKYDVEDAHPLTKNLFKTVTFDEIVDNVKVFFNLTDGVKQVMYVTGWQKGGFDNGYPEPFEVEERCGGLEKLRSCLTEVRRYNTLSGLHDNFDDISFELAGEFPYTAIDEAGEKWRGWIWAAGLTYTMGLAKYVKSGKMKERVDKMIDLLPLEDTYHLDVLTAEPCRHDFDVHNPASAQDSFDAKIKIIEEFNRHGLDVTSELLIHPAVGKIGFALHNRLDTDDVFIPGESFVPLVQMIYHGTIGYSCPSQSKTEILWGLLLGGQTFYEEDITGKLCVSRYYIQNIPAMLLYDKKMIDFKYSGDTAIAIYEDNSYIRVNFKTLTYTAIIDGVVVGKDFSTFVRGNSENSFLAYSFDGGTMSYPKPDCINDSVCVHANCLTTSGIGDGVTCIYDEESITLEMPSMTPVKIQIW